MMPHVLEGHVAGGHEQLTYALQGDVQKGLGRTGGPGTEVYNKLQIFLQTPLSACPSGPTTV